MSSTISSARAVSLPNLTVQQLEYLVSAADHPTRTAAAAAVGVTPSALTQGLAELERRVGLPLFERSGRQTRLRPQAAEVLAHARRVVAETRDLARWSMAQRSGTSGLVRLGTIDAVAVQHRAEAIRSFHRNQPDVDLRLTVAPSGILIDGLVSGDLDLIVCVEPVTTPPHRWGPWVTFPAGSHTRAVISTGLAAVGAPFEVVAESNQPEVLREMVRLGLGWTVLPPVGNTVGTGAMVPARSEPVAQRRLVVGRRAGAPADPAADALAAVLTGPESGR